MSETTKTPTQGAALDALKVVERYIAAETPGEPSERPPPPPRGPTLGLDIYEGNWPLSLADAYAEGYRFIWIKVSEGPYRDGTNEINDVLRAQVDAAREAGFAIGLYFYAIENNPKDPKAGAVWQVNLFFKELARHNVRLPGKGIAVDFERYYDPYSYLTPSNATLEHIGDELTRRLPAGYPKGVYSSESFWSGQQPGTVASGKWSRYGFDYAWISHWPTNAPLENVRAYAKNIPDAYSPFKDNLAAKAADIGQIAIGKVAGRNIDVNLYPGNLEEYIELTTGGATPEVEPEPENGNGKDKPKPKPKPKPEPEPEPEPKGWNPVTGSLAPPGFVRMAPQPRSLRYDLRNPTRFIWRPDVEKVVRALYEEFGRFNIFISTYVNHPAEIEVPRPNVSLDVWGAPGDRPGWRGLWIDQKVGQAAWDFLWDMPGEPNIAWGIWQKRIYGDWSGYAAQPFGEGSRFTNHQDHFHITYQGPFEQIH